MTNSLGATDEPLVHIGYKAYREPMLALGADLNEISGSRVKRNLRNNLFGASLGRPHAEVVVIDRQVLFVGSMYLGPRSATINTELGAVIKSPALARETARIIDIDRPESAYRLRPCANGLCCEWLGFDEGKEMLLTEEPDSSFWQRLKLILLRPFVPLSQLRGRPASVASRRRRLAHGLEPGPQPLLTGLQRGTAAAHQVGLTEHAAAGCRLVDEVLGRGQLAASGHVLVLLAQMLLRLIGRVGRAAAYELAPRGAHCLQQAADLALRRRVELRGAQRGQQRHQRHQRSTTGCAAAAAASAVIRRGCGHATGSLWRGLSLCLRCALSVSFRNGCCELST